MSKKIFDQQPSLQEYFETSDGKKFYSHNAATNHAAVLADKSVKNFKREDVSKEVEEDLSAKEAQKLANKNVDADAMAMEASKKKANEADEVEAKAQEEAATKEIEKTGAMNKLEVATDDAQKEGAKTNEEAAAKTPEAPIKSLIPAKKANKKPSNTKK